MSGFETESAGEAETEALAARLAPHCGPGTLILLEGDLGAGKTVFARGFVRAMGGVDKEGAVTSPTFTLLNVYPEGRLPVYHFDLYRLGEPEELPHMGAEEFLEGEGVALVEWPSKGGEDIPGEHLEVRIGFSPESPETRRIKMTARGERAVGALASFLDGNG